MKLLVIDNYDSFVFNIVHYLESLTDAEITVVKNDAISLDEVQAFDYILLSPGPGIPSQAGLMPQIIEKYHKTKSILGVCLGHQALGEFFGLQLKQLPQPLHGIADEISITQDSILFKNLPSAFDIGHYHSWVVSGKSSDELKIVALDTHQNIMAIEHKKYAVFGVQFHPESVLNQFGKEIFKNWLNCRQ